MDFNACTSKPKRLWFANPGPILSLQTPPILPTQPSMRLCSCLLLPFLTPYPSPQLLLFLPFSISLPSFTSPREVIPITTNRLPIAAVKISQSILHVSSGRYLRSRSAGEMPVAGSGGRHCFKYLGQHAFFGTQHEQ